jgi:hypothetical protein
MFESKTKRDIFKDENEIEPFSGPNVIKLFTAVIYEFL